MSEFNRIINNLKTKAEAKENTQAAVSVIAVTQALVVLAGLLGVSPDAIKEFMADYGAIVIAVVPVAMGVVKTLIRRINNKTKHSKGA